MGIGSTIDRFPFFITQQQKSPVFLPVSMKDLPLIQDIITSKNKSAQEYAISINANVENLLKKISSARMDHDFEFWAATTVRIKPKDGGDFIFFKLNRPQRKLLGKLENQRLANKPIRVILLKARQWGGSTLVQIYMAWIQLRHKTNWNSLIAAHINQAATNIRNMYDTLVDYYPLEKFKLKPFQGTQNIKIISQRSNKITIGSMQTPDSIRSDDIALAHLSEVGVWRKTDGKKPEDMIQSILGSIPDKPYSMVVLESTAKGVGNYFHRTWMKAKQSNLGFEPCFVAWFEIEMYQKPFDSDKDQIELIESLNEYEFELWHSGATLEGINWYRDKLYSYNGDMVMMASEFPSNDIEAFQSTGQRYFPNSTVQNARRFNRSPLFTGDVYADAVKGPESLNNVRIEKSNTGNLSIWSTPEKSNEVKFLNRYVVSLDIGGRSSASDYSVIKVIDRFWMMEGGIPEVAAVWSGHIDFDHLAWKAIQICKLYDDAYFIPEINKMREDNSKFDEGDQFYTIVDEIADYYENIYCRTNPEQIQRGLPKMYGFHMNSQTKPMVLNALNAAYRDGQIAEFDVRACDQADTFENKGNGKTGAVDGANDDHVIVSAIGTWAALYHMEPVKEVKIGQRTTRIRVPIGESSM
jgi:hypothetical protein